MRIHRLEISAFGPFAGTERIDFDRLSAHGLFLLNGATGAGKTSVLDAICFALYGSVPGARQDGKRLRSDHAEAAAEPRVTCEFSAKGRHFEVSRSPAWDKPSARGKNGFTLQQANTLLRERIDGAWVEKSGRNDEAGAEITDVLGMNREQFTRVVMLPQGDFAAFLRSKASDRLELLQSLFGTQRFEAVEQELSRQAQAAKAEVASLNARLDLLLAQAETETAALELDSADAPGRDAPDALLAWLDDAAATAAEERRAAAAAAERQAADRASRLEAANARASRHAKLAAAELRRNDADAAAPVLAEKAVTLGLHRKAEVLGGQLRAVESAAAAEALARTALLEAARQLRSAAVTDPELLGELGWSSSTPPLTAPVVLPAPMPLTGWIVPRSAMPRLAMPRSTVQPSGTHSKRCGPCAPCSPNACPTNPGSQGSRTGSTGCACSCRSWKPGGRPAPLPWTPCAPNRRPCPPESAPSRSSPRKSSCARRRPRQQTNSWPSLAATSPRRPRVRQSRNGTPRPGTTTRT